MRAPDFWHASDFGSRLVAAGLSPLGFLYGASVAWKASHAAPFRPRAKVVCVGNLTVGGTGKTPVAIALAEMLKSSGRKVFFLSRGYGGSERGPLLVSTHTAAAVGDEPLLLARVAPTIIAADRASGARLGDAQGADVIIMDDGHQNFALAKDLSLLVVDGESGFGNGHVVPAGPLREPVAQGLTRADGVIVMGNGPANLFPFMLPTIQARLEPVMQPGLTRVLAFAGIGRPEKFFQSLAALGLEVANTKSFGDHHAYQPGELAELRRAAKAANARLVTTEKDYLRLSPADRAEITAIPARLVLRDSEALERLLDRL